MPDRFARPISALVSKLETIASLNESERQAVRDIPTLDRTLPAGHDFVREGDVPHSCVLVVKGWVCRHKMSESGHRQIVSFHLPGDIPDLQSLLLTRMDHSLTAVTEARIANIAHDRLRALTRTHPRVAEALWRDTLIEASTYREWLLSLGRRPAPVRMAHLICELHARLRVLGLADDNAYALPITQLVMADALGLSPVHVNRSLQDLRAAGLISWAHGSLVIHDMQALAQLGEFAPGYLHQLAA
jgi:CRP-like cAMP-binding protein